ncbi:MAG: choice-of-anchor J domain-containing protein, partial [Thermoanaerobaculia bacterium]|nr:choice-of-anchor J domain-containing protein [Thermoanaerobaculia bacterium]
MKVFTNILETSMLGIPSRSVLRAGVVLLLVCAPPLWGSKFDARPRPAKAAMDLGVPLPAADLPAAVVLAEGFDDITTLPGAGWSLQNNSAPLGTTDWYQGNATVFTSHAGATTAYVAANYNNTGSVGTISNWLISPVIDYATVGRCAFFTRAPTASIYADRLEIRYSTAGASTDTGGTSTSVGDFTNNPLTVNPTLIGSGYPQSWTEFTVDFPASGSGRLALRYFVTDGGSNGTNSNYIGIDTLTCVDRAPAPVAAGATLVAESCTAANGTLDPGETVTVSLCVENTGISDTVDLIGTLAASGGVENPGTAQSFGVVAAGGAPVCRDFTFNVDLGLACGADVVATLGLQDGATSLPALTYTFNTGTLVSTTTSF